MNDLTRGLQRLAASLGDLTTRVRRLETREIPVAVQTIGTLQLAVFGTSAVGYDSTTYEKGFLIRLLNGSGAASVKGTLISASTSTDRRWILQNNEYDTIGVVAESGIADGAYTWIWVGGSVCQVLLKNSVAVTRGDILIAADTDGRAISVANPGSGLPGTDTHFKECGHVWESKSAGTDVLALAMLHFN